MALRGNCEAAARQLRDRGRERGRGRGRRKEGHSHITCRACCINVIAKKKNQKNHGNQSSTVTFQSPFHIFILSLSSLQRRETAPLSAPFRPFLSHSRPPQFSSRVSPIRVCLTLSAPGVYVGQQASPLRDSERNKLFRHDRGAIRPGQLLACDAVESVERAKMVGYDVCRQTSAQPFLCF